MKWIKIDDRSPVSNGEYVVWTNEGAWELAAFYKLEKGVTHWVFTHDIHNTSKVRATHWLEITTPHETLSEKIPDCNIRDKLDHIHHELWHLVEELKRLNDRRL